MFILMVIKQVLDNGWRPKDFEFNARSLVLGEMMETSSRHLGNRYQGRTLRISFKSRDRTLYIPMPIARELLLSTFSSPTNGDGSIM